MVENIILKNLETQHILELDVVTTPYYILDKVDWGQVDSKQYTYKYVNQIGVYVTGTSLNTRDVNVTGWIIASTDEQMSERKRMINRFVNPTQAISIRYKGYVLEFLPSKSIKYSATIKDNNNVVCRFEISGMAPDPLFKDENENKVTAAGTVGMFHFPLMLNAIDNGLPTVLMGFRQPSLIVNIYNKGMSVTGVRIVFKALGTVKNPSLLNVDTQEFFKVNKTLVAGEEIEVNTNIGSKKIVGNLNGVTENYFRYRDLDSTWLQLKVGDNLFRYDAEVGLDVLECYVYFYNRYLEVQECN
nr:MAG TPA: tail protein [Caudoviricetes sp.]